MGHDTNSDSMAGETDGHMGACLGTLGSQYGPHPTAWGLAQALFVP